jgi:hypothetical protein
MDPISPTAPRNFVLLVCAGVDRDIGDTPFRDLGEDSNDTSCPVSDDVNYEYVNVNYATGETNSSLSAYMEAQNVSFYCTHDGTNTSVFHTYARPGIYRP